MVTPEAQTGMSFKAIGRQMGYHYTVVSRLVRKHTKTNNVNDLPISGRPRVTSDRNDSALQRLVMTDMNNFFKTPDLDTQIRSVNILNFEQCVRGMVHLHD
jgi:hypothetical protein